MKQKCGVIGLKQKCGVIVCEVADSVHDQTRDDSRIVNAVLIHVGGQLHVTIDVEMWGLL